MRRPLWKDESESFFRNLRAQNAKPPRPVLSLEEANRWHAERGRSQAQERARNNYYLHHDSGSPLFPGDGDQK